MNEIYTDNQGLTYQITPPTCFEAKDKRDITRVLIGLTKKHSLFFEYLNFENGNAKVRVMNEIINLTDLPCPINYSIDLTERVLNEYFELIEDPIIKNGQIYSNNHELFFSVEDIHEFKEKWYIFIPTLKSKYKFYRK